MGKLVSLSEVTDQKEEYLSVLPVGWVTEAEWSNARYFRTAFCNLPVPPKTFYPSTDCDFNKYLLDKVRSCTHSSYNRSDRDAENANSNA